MRPQGRREALLLAVLEVQYRSVHPLRRVGIEFRACTALNRHYRPLLKKPNGDKGAEAQRAATVGRRSAL